MWHNNISLWAILSRIQLSGLRQHPQFFLHINCKGTQDISKLNGHKLSTMLHTSYQHRVYSGCHLRKFATNPVRSTLTDTARRIRDMEIVVDKMHFRGTRIVGAKLTVTQMIWPVTNGKRLVHLPSHTFIKFMHLHVFTILGWHRDLLTNTFMVINQLEAN